MKKKVINAAFCDTRDVTEDAMSGFDSITINAAALLTDAKSRELMSRYPVTLNAATVVDAPVGVLVKNVNGKHEIGTDADGENTLLIVNGKLTFENGSLDAAKRFCRIILNGKALMPRSFMGQLQNLTVNGKCEYYPDGAAILKKDTEIDGLFVARASKQSYYCAGALFFLDAGMDTEWLLEKGLRFTAKKIVIAEGLLGKLLPLIDEETEMTCVPDGTRLIDDDLELLPRTIRKYGPKLCVCGDVLIEDAEALSALEYLYADGTVRVSKLLAEKLEEVECVCDELKVIDPDVGYLCDRASVKVGPALLRQYPNGLRIEDCAKVTLSADLSPEEIMEKLQIADCAFVRCTKEQEEAVGIIAEDVAKIGTLGEDAEDGLPGQPEDVQTINAAEYKL